MNRTKTIYLDFKTKDNTIIEDCLNYWSLNDEYSDFKYKLRELTDKQNKFRETVLNNCNAYILCPICKTKINEILTTREDAKIIDNKTYRTKKKKFCSFDCFNQFNKMRSKKIEQENRKRIEKSLNQAIEDKHYKILEEYDLFSLYLFVKDYNSGILLDTIDDKYFNIKLYIELNLLYEYEKKIYFSEKLKSILYRILRPELRREKKRKLLNILYESDYLSNLDIIKYNFLVITAYTNNPNKALKIMEIEKNKKIINELDNENFLNIEFSDLPLIDEKLKQYLLDNGFSKSKKKIIDDKRHEIHLILKKEYIFVYPKISIKDLIFKEELDDVISKYKKYSDSIKKAYSGRVNFLICDSELGNPLFAIDYRDKEYVKKYPNQQEKDKYKKLLLLENGIIYYVIKNKLDLKKIKNHLSVIIEINNMKLE